MNDALGAAEGVLVLSGAGALPALALARKRLVVIPLIPLTGAVMASLSVTAMAGLGGSLAGWFIVFSLASAVAAGIWWWRNPASTPWNQDNSRSRDRLAGAIAGIAGLITVAFGLSSLSAPSVGGDARVIWLLHPIWYLNGHAETVMFLRDPTYAFSHPPYPPLVGGSVAMSWMVSGMHTDRLGVILVALLNACAVLAAASAVVEVSRRLSKGTRSLGRAVILGTGIVAGMALIMVSFDVAGIVATNGLADLLWASAAVGAVSFGLVLPIEPATVGTALVLAAVAGTTKTEGSITAAVIVLLIAARIVIRGRSAGEQGRGWRMAAGVMSVLVAIGAWPLVILLLQAVADVPNVGVRTEPDSRRLHLTVTGAWGQLHVLALAIIIAVAGALLLRSTRQRAEMGGDGWAWAALVTGLGGVVGAYVFGPGDLSGWLRTSINRTTIFPALASWWIIATWFLIAVATLQPVLQSELPRLDSSSGMIGDSPGPFGPDNEVAADGKSEFATDDKSELKVRSGDPGPSDPVLSTVARD
jgi:hypothetical protein